MSCQGSIKVHGKSKVEAIVKILNDCDFVKTDTRGNSPHLAGHYVLEGPTPCPVVDVYASGAISFTNGAWNIIEEFVREIYPNILFKASKNS